MAELTMVAVTVGRALAGAVVGPLFSRARDRAMGTPSRRRLERICAEVLAEAVRERAANDEDADHVLSVLERVWTVPARSVGPEAVEEWTRHLSDAGIDATTLPVDLTDLLGGMLALLRERIRIDAARVDSPLFRLVALDGLDALGDHLAVLIPLEPSLQRRLDEAREMCRVTHARFRTPHLLLALLAADSVGRTCFDALRPGFGGEVADRLAAYVRRGSGEPYEEFDWSQDTVVREARRLALQERADEVSDPHILLALLDAEPASATVAELRDHLGSRFALLVSRVRSAPREVRYVATPGPVLELP
ncbi:Clp protease N-terminal domain-containing protein [Streptomyces malaysiensis]|uniref:Clp protease N-terminal domain-containing protein n=1 Tax=Streptomyces malaysiensis TaxID=92644 RepID=UPI00372129AB